MASKVEMAFQKLLRAYGKRKNVLKRGRDGKLKSTPGTWVLDSNGFGHKVAEITNVGGGERDLFDMRRRKSSDFVKWVDITVQALKQRKRR